MRTELNEGQNYTYSSAVDFWSFLSGSEIKKYISDYLDEQPYDALLDHLIHETDFNTFEEIKRDKELKLKWLRFELEAANRSLPLNRGTEFHSEVKSDIELLEKRIKECLEEN